MSTSDLTIDIPPPPSEDARLDELQMVAAVRQYDRTDPYYLHLLDEVPYALFDAIVTEAGYPSDIDYIKRLSNRMRPVIIRLKAHFNSLRPWELARKHNVYFDYDYVESAQTPSYPSGHTAQAHYTAGMLSRKYPELQGELQKLASDIEASRLIRGVHFISDNEAGKMVANQMLRGTP